jgi:hypothetical protein
MSAPAISGSRFIVDLGDVKLPALVEKEVEARIRAVVLRALAENAYSTADARSRGLLDTHIFDEFPGRTLGLFPDSQYPPADGPLGPQDHTLIVRAIMEHPVEVVHHLPTKARGVRPSSEDVLRAALQVDEIDPYTRGRIRAALDALPTLEEGLANAPEHVKRAIDRLRDDLSGKPVDEQLRLLRDPSARQRYGDVQGLAETGQAVARMLEDGRDSIYSPDFSFYRRMDPNGRAGATLRGTVDDIKDADAIGATGGGFVGTVVPGLGTAAGAASAGAGASAGAAIAHFVDWLFD